MWRYLWKSPKPSKNNYEFKLEHSFEKRKKESSIILKKNPDKIPVILERSDFCHLSDIDKHKFLLKKELTFGEFIFIVRRRLNLDQNKSLYMFINNEYTPGINEKVEDVYNVHGDKDGFLYITYASD